MSDKTYGDAMRELESKIGMPIEDVPFVDHHDNCGLGWIGYCTCDPKGQCNLVTLGECDCGPPTQAQKVEWLAEKGVEGF